MNKGYTEWVRNDNTIAIILNTFGRCLYVNLEYPDGEWSKHHLKRDIWTRERLKTHGYYMQRTFDKAELMLELL